jgi:hypothetical protein
MFIGDNMILRTYLANVLFLGKSAAKLEAKIKAIQARGFKLTIEDNVYAFLGVEVHKPRKWQDQAQTKWVDSVQSRTAQEQSPWRTSH